MKKYKFKATIQGGPNGGAGVAFPYDVDKEFSTKANVPVKATLDGVPYTGSLMNCGMPSHMLAVLKSTRERIGKNVGDEVEVEVWRDEELRTVKTPPDFEKLLNKEGLLVGFKKLSYTHQKEYVRWITEAKKKETRQNRMMKAMAMLKSEIKTPG